MRNLFRAALAVLLFMIWLSAPSFAGGIDSEQAATDMGDVFAQAMNWQYGRPSKAIIKEVAGYGALWRVEFSGAALVNIDPATGQIIMAADLSQNALLYSNPGPVEDKIGETKARETAERVLDVVGRPIDARFLSSDKSQDNREWRFLWVRTFFDIAYRDDMIMVKISSINGKLLGYGRSFVSAPPPSVEVKLTADDAMAAARNIMLSLTISESEIGTANTKLQVIQPNNYWGPGNAIEDWGKDGPSRVAWIVMTNQNKSLKEFWIDAENGNLLGGTQTKSPGFTNARLKENVSGAGWLVLTNSYFRWLIIGVSALFLLLLILLRRRLIKGRVRLCNS